MIDRYLQQYGEAEARSILAEQQPATNLFGALFADHRSWQGGLVIPAFDESPAQLALQIEAMADQDVLLVLVINAPDDAEAQSLQRTLQLLEQVKARRDQHVLLIDRVSAGRQIDARLGVGLARKVGCDVAAALFLQERVRSPWILQSDADVAFPADYTKLQRATSDTAEAGAKIFPHRHYSTVANLQLAANLYDQHMNYYVTGLQRAGSPYAHHSLGSTIAIHAQSYAAVRGYPKRSAGEDFYLLNKVRKIAPVERLAGPTLQIQARLSQRVPFGTGPALRDIVTGLQQDASGESYHSYHPKCFEQLAIAIRTLNDWAAQPDSIIEPSVGGLLAQLGFARFANSLSKQRLTAEQRYRSTHDWFDGLKTLRFIHGCQATWPDQPLTTTLAAIDPAFQAKVFEFQANIDDQLLTGQSFDRKLSSD